MEQITNYFEHMDYVSFVVVALPCVVIAAYGFLQVASGLAKCKSKSPPTGVSFHLSHYIKSGELTKPQNTKSRPDVTRK